MNHLKIKKHFLICIKKYLGESGVNLIRNFTFYELENPETLLYGENDNPFTFIQHEPQSYFERTIFE
jgi:hypothetical protein